MYDRSVASWTFDLGKSGFIALLVPKFKALLSAGTVYEGAMLCVWGM